MKVWSMRNKQPTNNVIRLGLLNRFLKVVQGHFQARVKADGWLPSE